jgi:two-component system response regulator CpxR
VLLDVMLTDIDGFEVLTRLREFSRVYVMLLTTRGEAPDRVRGLQIGADDYLPKPFDVEELVARIHAILRRGIERDSAATTAFGKPKLKRAGFTIDFHSRTVFYGNQNLYLTDIELSLLETFLESPGVVLPREDLAVRVFNRPFHPLDRSLDMYISRLRRKLRTATAGNHIKTIRSSGYQFAGTDSTAQSYEVH